MDYRTCWRIFTELLMAKRRAFWIGTVWRGSLFGKKGGARS